MYRFLRSEVGARSSGVRGKPAAGASLRATSRAGFTLLETLLSLAIIALLASVLIGGSARLLDQKAVTPEEIFWNAVREARKTALKVEHDIRLKFDREKKQFLIIDGIAPATVGRDGMAIEETPLKAFPVPVPENSEFNVEFLGPPTKGAHLIMIAGVVLETETRPYVTFYADGTCSPFRAQFFQNSDASILNIDPWTCAPVFASDDRNAP